MFPQYKVSWIDNTEVCRFKETCVKIDRFTGNKIPCSRRIPQQSTWAFPTPEKALEQALYVLGQGHTLLFVEQ
jgi:hypothetical protein